MEYRSRGNVTSYGSKAAYDLAKEMTINITWICRQNGQVIYLLNFNVISHVSQVTYQNNIGHAWRVNVQLRRRPPQLPELALKKTLFAVWDVFTQRCQAPR